MNSLTLSLRSMKNRLTSSVLTMASIAVSITLLLLVAHIREGTKDSFASTVSGTDLIVGARSGQVQLLLSSVFRIGNASNNVSWDSYQEFAHHPEVDRTIPISLGDSHLGFRVVGTTGEYFTSYKVRNRNLGFQQGRPFSGVFEAVVGSEVAEKLGYGLNRKLVLAHGVSEISFEQHDDRPFTLVGILERTGTPVDRAVYVSLEGIEAMHMDWQNGAPPLDEKHLTVEEVLRNDLQPKAITAFFVTLKSKIGIFSVQRAINDYPKEPLLAILPGATLSELWETVALADRALFVVLVLVILSGVLGMVASLLTTLQERRREMAILRALGAHPRHIFFMLISEALSLALGGVLCGVIGLYALLFVAQPFIERRYGVYLEIGLLTLDDLKILASILLSAGLAGIIPALAAYKNSLTDGLTIRL